MSYKITIRIIVWIFVLVAISLFIILFMHKVSVKGYYKYCTSISESKRKGFYITRYVPARWKVDLKLRKGSIMSDTAWAEYAWHIQANNFISTLERVNDKGYNLVLKIRPESFRKFVWGFDFKRPAFGQTGGFDISDYQYDATVYYLPDTIKVFLKEKNLTPGIGWKKPIITDTFIYIKSF